MTKTDDRCPTVFSDSVRLLNPESDFWTPFCMNSDLGPQMQDPTMKNDDGVWLQTEKVM